MCWKNYKKHYFLIILIYTFGNPLQSEFNEMLIFARNIFATLSVLDTDYMLVQGRSPFAKYINIYPIDSRSSLLDYSLPS